MSEEKLSTVPNEKYAKFFAQFAEINDLEIVQWKPVHLIGYFCKQYHERYKMDYQFKFNTPTPPKCFEVWQMRKLGSILSTDPSILRGYIDWVFQTKVPTLKRRFTSISFLSKEEFVNEFKWKVLTSEKKELRLDRSTLLPSSYQTALSKIGGMTTYGDLAFSYSAFRAGNWDLDGALDFSDALDELERLGFDLAVLEKVI